MNLHANAALSLNRRRLLCPIHRSSGYYDVELRDFGLLLAALTLARLASKYDPPWFGERSSL